MGSMGHSVDLFRKSLERYANISPMGMNKQMQRRTLIRHRCYQSLSLQSNPRFAVNEGWTEATSMHLIRSAFSSAQTFLSLLQLFSRSVPNLPHTQASNSVQTRLIIELQKALQGNKKVCIIPSLMHNDCLCFYSCLYIVNSSWGNLEN